MEIPFQVRMAAALAGAKTRDFAIGWANGTTRCQAYLTGVSADWPPNPYPQGSLRYAASNAAVTFLTSRWSD
jgi:hypothetical protein